MKKIIILGLSLFMGTQAFAFGMNATGSASTENNTLSAKAEIESTCIVTREYRPVCAVVSEGDKQKTFSNASEAKCKKAKIIHDGKCESASVKTGKDSKDEKVVGFQGLQVEARPRSTDMVGFDSEVVELDIHTEAEDGNGLLFGALDKDEKENKLEFHAEVKFSSNEAKEKVTLGGQVDATTEVNLENDDEGNAYYSVKGEKKAKFLGLFNVNMNVEAKIDAETGEVLEVETPWYSIFLF